MYQKMKILKLTNDQLFRISHLILSFLIICANTKKIYKKIFEKKIIMFHILIISYYIIKNMIK